MTGEPNEPASALGRRHLATVVVVIGVIVLAAVVSAMALHRGGAADHAARPLTVGWGGSEGHPPCVYDAKDHAVDCTLLVEGKAGGHDTVTVTVTAYADENTSDAVGSSTRSVPVAGTMHTSISVTIPVDRPAHVDDDGVAACRLSVKY